MKNLLVPIDFSDVTDRVIATAEQMARALSANVILMHCASDQLTIAAMGEVPVVFSAPEIAARDRFPEQKRLLMKYNSALRNKGIDAKSFLIVGAPAHEILAAADEYQVELIIMGSHGHGAIYELMVGTVTQAVIHHTGHSVLIVPSRTDQQMKAVPAADRTEPELMPL